MCAHTQVRSLGSDSPLGPSPLGSDGPLGPLRARECRSEVSALLILGVWLRPRAVLDER